MAQPLSNKTVAILLTDGFEQVEMTEPRKALEQAGAQVHLVAPKAGEVKGWKFTEWGNTFPVDRPLEQANPSEYDALMLPGGVMNPDHLRVNEQAQQFVRAFFERGKPVAAICHAPWTLINAGVAEGRTMTSYHSIKTDLINAGVQWVDQAVVVDGALLTSRNPDDLDDFNRAMIELFATGAEQPATGRQPSEAPNTSFDTGAGVGATGYDSPRHASSHGSNVDYHRNVPDPKP
ncbi:MAG: type 1 glutamine amidotransferase [Chloroflexaceae bacterium]|nr:type 1 glutamine amidotransferase [Chloroflexaceae bacterium]NJL34851.1 type 1 glutamine amidotransferase [Chloroflexaceae bacterium]NJO04662.1 type 1 glutamine amidotransferase [Chloroflexaceae bacterium]NJO83437.1 type 1 glutamine amidotransferase [Blastochloris sp.]